MPDGDKDYDGDLLSNAAELTKYRSDPANAYTFSSVNDAEYKTTGRADGKAEVSFRILYPVGGMIPFEIYGAAPDAAYDLFISPTVAAPTWRRYYSGSPGQTYLLVPIPPPGVWFFRLGLASDSDGDGLTDGYEALVSKTGLNTRDSDWDTLPDGWEVQYGLNPLSNSGHDGKDGDPDNDSFSNFWEWNNGTDPKRHNFNQPQRPVITVTVPDPTASEGTSDTATFRISRSGGDINSDLTVYYVLGGTATVGPDYSLDPAPSAPYPGYSVTIYAGQTSRDIQIIATGDTLTEGAETVILGLATDPNDQYAVASHPHRAMASIRDTIHCHTYENSADFLSGLLVGLVANNDRLYLKSSSEPQFPYINVACSGRGTVARIDVNTGTIIGEYRTTPEISWEYNGDPSRTTVNQYGDVWVANRADSLNELGSVTKIGLLIPGQQTTRWTKLPDGTYQQDPNGQYFKGPFAYSTCLDRDGDGYIRTSRGLGDILPWSNERGGVSGVDSMGGVSTAEDEAILEYVRVQGTGTRTVAVDKFNDIWVGGTDINVHQKVDGLIAQVLPETVFSPGCGGYGGLIDGNGVLWSAMGGSGLLRFVPPASRPPQSGDWQCLGNGYGNYGLAIDPLTGTVWHTDYYNGCVYTWSPNGSPNYNCYSTGGSLPKGVVVDKNGNVWVANSGGNTVAHLRNDGTYIGTVSLTLNSINGVEPTGVAVDSSGKIWVTCYYSDNVMRIDPNAGPEMNGYNLGAVDLVVDLGSGARPYNYSDMTGFNNQIVNAGGCPLKGYWTIIEDGSMPDLKWVVTWNAATPSGTELMVYARASNDRLALSNQQFVEVLNGVQIPDVRGRYLEVRTALRRNTCGVSPYLESLTICGYGKTLSALPLQNQSIEEGQDAVFRVIAFGTEPLSYQWHFNGVPIQGANSPELRLTTVDCLDSGLYGVHITDASGDEVDVGPAELDVYPRVIVIPSVGIASVYPAEIRVEGAPNSVSSVEVVLYGFKHSRPDDVDILLISPTGKKIMLMSDAGGNTSVEDLTIRFVEWGSLPLDNGPFTSHAVYYFVQSNYGEQESSLPLARDGNPSPPGGPYTDSLSDLNGTDPNGVWRLYIVDDTEMKSGYISGSWCLILNP